MRDCNNSNKTPKNCLPKEMSMSTNNKPNNTSNTKAQTEEFMKQGIDSLARNLDNLSGFAKENIEAVIQSANITAKAAEKIVNEALALSKQNIEQNIAAAKDFSNVRTFDQFVNAQTKFSKQLFDQYVEQASKIGDLVMCMSKEASAPINDRVTALSETFSKNTEAFTKNVKESANNFSETFTKKAS